MTAKGCGDQIAGLHHQIGESGHQEQKQEAQQANQGPAGAAQKRRGGQLFAGGLQAQAPAALQLLQLQRHAQAHHHQKGHELE